MKKWLQIGMVSLLCVFSASPVMAGGFDHTTTDSMIAAGTAARDIDTYDATRTRGLDTNGINGNGINGNGINGNGINGINDGMNGTNGNVRGFAADDDAGNWGWLGLLGLIGLAGMFNRGKER